MNIRLQDGQYFAHLDQSEVKQSAGGRPVICFKWRLDKSGVLVRSYVGMTLNDGSPNEKGIALVRKWAVDWDGKDPYWFGENRETARGYAVRLKIANEPAWNDPSRIVRVVKWVNPAVWRPVDAESSPRQTEEKILAAPDIELEPTMSDTWRLWCSMTEGCSLSFRDKTWLWHVKETAPNKDQVDFTAEDWSRMQQHIKLVAGR